MEKMSENGFQELSVEEIKEVQGGDRLYMIVDGELIAMDY